MQFEFYISSICSNLFFLRVFLYLECVELIVDYHNLWLIITLMYINMHVIIDHLWFLLFLIKRAYALLFIRTQHIYISNARCVIKNVIGLWPNGLTKAKRDNATMGAKNHPINVQLSRAYLYRLMWQLIISYDSPQLIQQSVLFYMSQKILTRMCFFNCLKKCWFFFINFMN